MADPEQINADMLAFWNGQGGHTWVARQEHTDITLTPVTEALLAFAAPRPASGCWISAAVAARPRWTLRVPSALPAAWRRWTSPGRCWPRVRARAKAAGIANVDWRQADPATAALDEYDLLASAFGVMFFGDAVAAFAHMRRAASHGCANGVRVLAAAGRKSVDGGADERGRAAPAAAAEAGPERPGNVRLRRSGARH